MEKLIPVANQIRDALATANMEPSVLELPQIAVVGGQSVGKSSLLEGLVGRAFLPTGTGVVTRRPLVLRLEKARASAALSAETAATEWGEFAHLPGQRIFSFDEIREEISRDTERVCGDRAVISHEPIILKITSPKVVDLTLVDLPGIARVPVGDQPPDIEHQIKSLIFETVRNPRCLILAVVAGNADLATADALAVAREVDPEGVRTLGVVTKLDMVDHGADLLPVLQGQVYSLRLGFVGVVCRSIGDVKEGKAVTEHLEKEEQFFRRHPKYRALSARCGINHLMSRLSRILMDHICDALPDIRRQTQQLIDELEVEVGAHGESLAGSPLSDQGALVLNLFTKFAARFGDAIEGKLAPTEHGELGSVGQLAGRARIDFIFRDVFAKTVRNFDSFSGLSDDEIRVAIRNTTGPRATLFVPEAALELLARKQISKLQFPSLQCADLVFDELQRVLQMSELPEFRRFVNLREQVFGVVRDILRRNLEPTTQMIRDVIAIELAYINTSHPDFAGQGGGGMGSGPGPMPSPMVPPPNPPGPPPRSQDKNLPQPSDKPVEQIPQQMPQNTAGPSGGQGAATPSQVESVGLRGFFPVLPFFRPAVRPGTATGDEETTVVPSTVPAKQHRASSLPPMGTDAPGSNATPADIATAIGTSADPSRPPLTVAQNLPIPTPGGGLRQLASRAGVVGLGGVSTTGVLRLPHVPPAIMPADSAPTQRERVEVGIIKSLLEKYLAIVKKNVADSVPKAVMFFMVNGLRDTIQSECVARLYKDNLFSSLLQEAPGVQERRSECTKRLRALKRVMEVLNVVT